MTEVMAFATYDNNADLIKTVAGLGYIGDIVCDPTYGLGNFYTEWWPTHLVASDLDPNKSPGREGLDMTGLPYDTETFDTVVLDPPYKLNGRPTDTVDERYGVHRRRPWQYRHLLICDAIDEAARLVIPGGTVLLKCMDQVCGGHKRWQTIEFTNHASRRGLALVDRFVMLTTPRPQPLGQVTARENGSTLLVFRKPTRRRWVRGEVPPATPLRPFDVTVTRAPLPDEDDT